MGSGWQIYANSFGGSIEGIEDIYVDNFENKHKRFYFLSHMHSDHFGGLMVDNRNDLINSDAKIFMTEESRLIFLNTYQRFYKNVKDQIVTIGVGKCEKIGDNPEKQFHVTFIKVEHMVGAVMFLFKTVDKTILYTGDFVIKAEDLKTLTLLHDESGKPIEIDLLYYDATFKDIENLPEQEQCTLTILEKLEQWLKENDANAVGLHMYYTFGYEKLYKAIVEKFDKDIYLHSDVLVKTYDSLNIKDITTEISAQASRIHICFTKYNKEQNRHEECGFNMNDFHFKKFFISALSGLDKNYQPGQPTVKDYEKEVAYFSYPTHCNKNQLDEFLAHFSPKKAVPFSIKHNQANCQTPQVKQPATMAVTPVKRPNDCELEPPNNAKRQLQV